VSLCRRFAGLLRRLFGTNNNNAYRPLPTDEAGAAGNVQQSNNADVDDQSSAVVSPRSLRRRTGVRSPVRQVPALQTIPEERGEDGAGATDDPAANANANNSSLLRVANYTNSNANNSSANTDTLLVRLQDAEHARLSLSRPPPVRGGGGARRASTGVLPRLVNRVDDDGFETVDLFTP